MKVFLYVTLVFFLWACGGSLSDDQRKQLREKMEENKIVRVTEVEITEAAFQEGRRLVRVLDSLGVDSSRVKRFAKEYQGDIRFITASINTNRLLERQLMDAYLADTTGNLQDNVQNVRNDDGEVDSLLYTYPVVRTLSDGRTQFHGIWSIWLSKKDLVKDIGRKKD